MSKKVALVGHCGPDSSYLKSAIHRAEKNATIVLADSDEELSDLLEHGVDLLLFNRDLGYGFAEPMGISCIAKLHAAHPRTRMMLISNYPDAQEAAVSAGALPGFGKREIGSPRVVELLKNALA